MIRDAKIGSKYVDSLIIRSATIKQTKAGKPYLQMELFDGHDSIQAMDWDYKKPEPPAKNLILNIEAEVSEWQGVKQLKLNFCEINRVMSVAEFAPKGPMNIADYDSKFLYLVDQITCMPAKDLCINIYNDFAELWNTIPGAKGIHHAYVAGTLKHSVDTATKALALADATPGCNRDLCIAGGLLHDFGKLWTYELNGASIEYTDEGNLLDHIPLGLMKIEKYRNETNYNIVSIIQHIMASHHGQLEWGSPVTPACIEAWLVHLADMADARSTTINELCAKAPKGAKYTEKSYTLGNRFALTQEYVNEVMK